MREKRVINLLEETIENMSRNGKTPDDVEFVRFNTRAFGSCFCEWDEFEAKASSVNYTKDYSGPHINSSLEIVGNGWWMERGEYDGLEWWEFCERPKKPKDYCAPELLEDLEI